METSPQTGLVSRASRPSAKWTALAPVIAAAGVTLLTVGSVFFWDHRGDFSHLWTEVGGGVALLIAIYVVVTSIELFLDGRWRYGFWCLVPGLSFVSVAILLAFVAVFVEIF